MHENNIKPVPHYNDLYILYSNPSWWFTRQKNGRWTIKKMGPPTTATAGGSNKKEDNEQDTVRITPDPSYAACRMPVLLEVILNPDKDVIFHAF